MILCHKCSGLLAYADNEDTTGLLDCSCISGYVRGFEPMLNRRAAIAAQLAAQKEWQLLYMRQNRSLTEINQVLEQIHRLEKLS